MKPVRKVTLIITARNRPEDLACTLQGVRRQNYSDVEVLVFDDASEPSLEDTVRRYWPDATFVRNETCQGLIANRTRAMRLAQGEYLVNLDDDSCFTDPEDINRAIARMDSEPELGIITFQIYQGREFSSNAGESVSERYVPSFIGCGHMLRKAMVDQIGGYRDFYFYYGEESEYSLRVWDAGWRILFLPSVTIHHRVASTGRSDSAILRYSIRNNLWTTVLHMPWPRLLLQTSWRMVSYAGECFRLLQFRSYLSGLASCIVGLPNVLRLRKAIHAHTLRILDALVTREVATPEQLGAIGQSDWRIVAAAHFRSWRNRPRQRSFWDRRAGDVGSSATVAFQHNFDRRAPGAATERNSKT